VAVTHTGSARVVGALSHTTRGDNAINGLGLTFCADSFDNDTHSSITGVVLYSSHHRARWEQVWQSTGLPPSSNVGSGASGFVAGLTSNFRRSRSISASRHCVVTHRPMPGWFGIVNHHRSQPTQSPLTQRLYAIPSAHMVSCYYSGRGCNDANVLVVAQVEGIGPMLPIMRIPEGGRRVCPWPSGLHKLRQHCLNSVFDGIVLLLDPTLPLMLLQRVFNMPSNLLHNNLPTKRLPSRRS
jgi:hypothetical protein